MHKYLQQVKEIEPPEVFAETLKVVFGSINHYNAWLLTMRDRGCTCQVSQRPPCSYCTYNVEEMVLVEDDVFACYLEK